MGNDIKKYIQTCEICQKTKKPYTKEPLYPIKIGKLFDCIGIDIVGPLPVTTTKKRYIVVATEYLSKWPEARALEKADAESVAEFIFEDLICRHGAPKEILSDQGSHFCNKLVDALCKKMTVVHSTSTAELLPTVLRGMNLFSSYTVGLPYYPLKSVSPHTKPVLGTKKICRPNYFGE